VTPDDPVTWAAELMRDRNVGALPVVASLGSRELVGILTDRDIVVRCVAAQHDRRCTVRSHMSSGYVATAGPDADSDEVTVRMGTARVRRLPVVDAGRRVLGIITSADIVRKLAGSQPVRVALMFDEIVQAGRPAISS
jgi:CBS domain-containing protein